jgi:hypothetical protein
VIALVAWFLLVAAGSTGKAACRRPAGSRSARCAGARPGGRPHAERRPCGRGPWATGTTQVDRANASRAGWANGTWTTKGGPCHGGLTMAEHLSSRSNDPPVRAARLRFPPVLVVGTVLCLVVVAGAVGVYLGVASQQTAVPTARQQATQADRTANERVRAIRESVSSREQAVAARTSELDQRKAALDQQQKDLDARIAGIKATSFGDGVWRVGADIQPGTYRATDTRECYWERMRDFGSGLDSIIANENVNGPAVVTIAPSDAGFKSVRCGTWTKVS